MQLLWPQMMFDKDLMFECFYPMQLITAVDPTLLRLTQADDAIYKAFREGFPDLKVEIIIEDEIKSAEGKEVRLQKKHV